MRIFEALTRAVPLPALLLTAVFFVPAVQAQTPAPTSPPAQAKLFNAESFTLANGMQVVVIPNHRVPVVTQMVFYKVGADDEVPGKSGLAHMLEHMMFKGTKAVPAGKFSEIIAQNGGRENAFTTADYTGFYQNISADRLELVMRLESDRMLNLAPPKSEFAPEHQVVIEERRMRIENQPSALLSEQMQASLFLNSPYHHPVIGWVPEVQQLTFEDVMAFYHRWYAPNNAVLIVAGDIDMAHLKPLAEKYYGKLPRRAVPVRPHIDEPPPVAARMIEMRDTRVHQLEWSKLYLAPSYHQGQIEDAMPLEVLSEILSGGSTARLYKTLVVDKKLAVSASAGYDPESFGLSSFEFDATPAEGISPETLGSAMSDLIRDVVANGVTQAELDQAKRRVLTDIAYLSDSYATPARILGRALASGETVEDVQSYPARVAAVTVEQINRAARDVFRDEASVTGILRPATEAEATVHLQSASPNESSASPFGREIR